MQWPHNDILRKSGPQRKNDPYSHDDLVCFEWDSTFSPSGYKVIVGTKDIASSRWKSVGSLARHVVLPPIIWGSNTAIALVHEDQGKPRFLGVLNRGVTYILRPSGALEQKGVSYYLY